MMSRKERVRAAIQHRQPEMVPWQISFTQPARKKLTDLWGPADLDERLGNHLSWRRTGLSGYWDPTRPDRWVDEFSVVWNRTVDKDIGNPEDYVLQRVALDDYRWPDPHDPSRYAGFPDFIKSHSDSFLIFGIDFSLFERAWTLRGMEQLMVDMIDQPEYVEELLERILAYNLALIDEACAHDFDGIYTGDDWGQQQGLLMGPVLWRRFVKPVLRRMYGRVKEHGKFVLIHSCGDIEEIIPDLIEVGVDVLNPFQPEVMDVRRMKREYGKDLSFWGGVSIQHTLPYGSPEQVKEEVCGLMRDIGAGGGYIIAPAHDMPGDIPVENMLALIETVQNQ